MKRIYLLIMTLTPLLCQAQRVFTLHECIGLAKQNNKRIVIAQFQKESARLQKKEALSNFLPQLSVTGTGLYATTSGTLSIAGGILPVVDENSIPTGAGAYFPGIELDYKVGKMYGVGFSVLQPIFTGGKIITAYRLATIRESVARQNSRLAQSEVVLETTRAYANLIRANAMYKVAHAYKKLLEELKQSVKKAMEQGMKSRNDLLKVEVRLNESELNLRRAENAHRLAAMNLCHYIGAPLDTPIEASTELPATAFGMDAAIDINNRPEMQILTDKSESMRMKINMARAEMLPQIGLIGQYGYMHGFKLAGKNLFGKWSLVAGIQISIPIIGLGSYSKYRLAQIHYRQAKAEEEEKYGLMTLEATQAANNLDEAALELKLARQSVASASENLRVSNSQYRVGTETLSDHLEAQALWLQAEQSLIDARISQFLHWIEYRKATGKLN